RSTSHVVSEVLRMLTKNRTDSPCGTLGADGHTCSCRSESAQRPREAPGSSEVVSSVVVSDVVVSGAALGSPPAVSCVSVPESREARNRASTTARTATTATAAAATRRRTYTSRGREPWGSCTGPTLEPSRPRTHRAVTACPQTGGSYTATISSPGPCGTSSTSPITLRRYARPSLSLYVTPTIASSPEATR